MEKLTAIFLGLCAIMQCGVTWFQYRVNKNLMKINDSQDERLNLLEGRKK